MNIHVSVEYVQFLGMDKVLHYLYTTELTILSDETNLLSLISRCKRFAASWALSVGNKRGEPKRGRFFRKVLFNG